MNIKILKLILVCNITLSMIPNAIRSETKQCTQEEAVAAEKNVSNLKNWQDVYKSFKKYRHCDDGCIAEGYSDVISSLLANSWSTMRSLKILISKDKAFYSFVLRHIDATCETTILKKIVTNAKNHHSSKNNSLYIDIQKEAEEALLEQSELLNKE